MDWNLVIAIVGIIICSLAAFFVGFGAGASFGRLKEHEVLNKALDRFLAHTKERDADEANSQRAREESIGGNLPANFDEHMGFGARDSRDV